MTASPAKRISSAHRTMATVEKQRESGKVRTTSRRLVGRYVVYDEIARGGLGTVHFARLVGPVGFARTVVAKLPHPSIAGESAFALMFMDEARLAARIRHPNVVSTLDVIHLQGQLAVIMEYVHGESLAALVAEAKRRGQRVAVEIAVDIVADALQGMHAAHEATDERGAPLGIVHRDVSPQNIMVGVDGVTRLLDFGIAKASGRLQGSTLVGSAAKGKSAYLAPEQVRGEPVDRRTDLFAAAIVLWELLTGERLFRGPGQTALPKNWLHTRIPSPREIVPEIPRRVDAIVMKALSRSPAERYATARDMALDLEACFPRVRASTIGAWVGDLARDTLATRAALLKRVERDGAGPPEDDPDIDSDVREISTVSASSGGGKTRPDPAEIDIEFDDVTVRAPHHVISAQALPSAPRIRSARVVAAVPQIAEIPSAARVDSLSFDESTRSAPVESFGGIGRFSPADDREASEVPHAPLRPGPSKARVLLAAALFGALVAVAAQYGPELLVPGGELREQSAAVVKARRTPARPLEGTPDVQATTRATAAIKPAPLPGSPATKARVDCNPPYTMDERGHKLFKVDCL
jgi:serine/threonine protein kinase